MNYINIKGLEVFAYHGVLEAEKTLGQKFVVNAKLGVNTQQAAMTDDVNDTIHYGHVCKDIIDIMQQDKYDLIEKCVDEIVDFLFQKYELLQTITLEVIKPWAPIHKHISNVSVEVNYMKNRVVIGMGSNVGDSNEYFNNAISAISNLPMSKVVKETSRIVTEPYGDIAQDNFLNSILEIETMLTPQVLLSQLNEIEKENNRKRDIKWGPRTLDLDILLFGNLIINENNLIVPHIEINNRQFVLQSLVELDENLINPLTHQKYKEIYEKLKLE